MIAQFKLGEKASPVFCRKLSATKRGRKNRTQGWGSRWHSQKKERPKTRSEVQNVCLNFTADKGEEEAPIKQGEIKVLDSSRFVVQRTLVEGKERMNNKKGAKQTSDPAPRREK